MKSKLLIFVALIALGCTKEYDVVVIGGGTGGTAARRRNKRPSPGTGPLNRME